MIQDAFSRLDHYCRGEGYKGWDIFDGLNSRFFRNSAFNQSRFMRLAWLQFFKRLPVNFRPLAQVPKGFNAKGLGLFVSGLVASKRIEEAKEILDILRGMACKGFDGMSWGYNFPWEARAFFVPQGKPNLVTTVFVANSFLDYFENTGDEDAISIAKGACEFLLSHLRLFENRDSLCFAYIPSEEARVHNANMMGAALLSRVYSHLRDDRLLEKSRKAMTYSVNALNNDFSWPYGERHHHRFIDNFHTGFNLVALHDWMHNTGEYQWGKQLLYAYRYFLDTFWLDNGCPKYYNDSLYPIDIHCSAQGIVTCLKLSEIDKRSAEMAKTIAYWAIENMQDKEGFFYYQKTKWYTNKIPYMRWSQAWMFFALALLLKTEGEAPV